MSNYMRSLKPEVKLRYSEKIALINNVDPYDCSEMLFNREIRNFPTVDYHDMIKYFVYKKSAYTRNEFRAHKALDSYKFFQCDRVRDILVQKFGENVLVLGKVLHSQKLTDKPLRPWFIAEKKGEILCGHCTCVAGLGETCSHVGALMFAVDFAVREYDPISCTDKIATWVVPSNKSAPMASWQDISETSGEDSEDIPEVTDAEIHNFFCEIQNAGITSAYMTVTKPFCENLQSEKSANILCSLYNKEHENKSLTELIKIADNINFSVTVEDCQEIEVLTRGQSKTSSWFEYRAGRITASRFKSSCCTTLDKPAISTVKAICYPSDSRFFSKATSYGCQHEKEALKVYRQKMEQQHINFVISSVGLLVHTDYPYFGASPDSVVICDCCGEGCVEIKCPYCARDSSIKEMQQVKQTCIGNDPVKLKESHSYFYQVQMQLIVGKKKYCDFVMWSNVDTYIERLTPNYEFWERESAKAFKFWKQVILPELLGKYFTNKHSAQPVPSTSRSENNSELDVQPLLWCHCRKADSGSFMVKCDNANCEIVWFHADCVGVKRKRKVWRCDGCK